MVITYDWLAIIIAAVLNFVVGWLWYGMIFKEAWIRLSGHSMQSMEEMKQSGATPMRGYIVSIILGLVTPLVFFSIASSMTVLSLGEALQLGFWLWLGFMVPISIGDVLWGAKPWKLFFLNAGNLLVTIIIMALVYTWRFV